MAAALVVASTAEPARADDCYGKLSTCIDADNLWLRPGSSDHLAVGSGWTTPAGEASFGFVGSYSSRPITLVAPSVDPDGRKIRALDNLFDGSFLLAVGVTDRFELTLAAPMTFFQDGAGVAVFTGSGATLARSTLRDPRFGFTYAILPRSRKGKGDGLSVLGRLEFGAPLGDGTAFARSPTATLIPAVTGQLVLGRFEASLEAGARIRGESTLGSATWGSQLSVALAGSVVVWEKRHLALGLEAFALPTLAAQKDVPALVPAEWMGEASIAPFLGGDVSFTVAGGGALPFTSSTLTEPRMRFTGALRYAPRGTDRDGDGVLDRNDLCPDVPEDRDGFQDDDGCPDPDNDQDGIPDKLDRCRDEPEDKDGFQDDDGCPDLDDDHDGVADVDDACRMEPEDKDGFQDEDGCPDPDNDHDGIPDAADLCPNAPEDKDGFQDGDGCPDDDNDHDGVQDVADRCPDEPEDLDHFRDEDGCPDPDNDQDGIPDKVDVCPNAAETINGIQDEDGCPEPGQKSLVRWVGNRVELEPEAASVKGSGRFEPGRTKPTAALAKELAMIAQLVRGRPNVLVILEAYADRASDTSQKAQDLAGARASVARDALVSAGLPRDEITAAAGDPGAKRAASAPQLDVTVEPRPNASPKQRNTQPKE